MYKTLLIMIMILVSFNSSWSKNNIPKEQTMQIEFDKTKISYTEKGQGDITLLFIHGWCINKSYWDAQLEFFSKNYKTIALDLPGFGNSTAERENWTIEEYSSDIINFMDRLKLKNVILVGHSMAGEIILETALTDHQAIKGIIGIDTFKIIDVPFSPKQIEEMNAFMKELEKDFNKMAPSYVDLMLVTPATDPAVTKRLKSDFATTNPAVGFLSISSYINYTRIEAGKLQSLNYKLHLLNSDGVPTNIAGLEKHCKSSFELFDVKATSHYPMIENPDGFNQELQKIINQI
ncbi:MAG: alpha/beta hydrolase [Calditrichaeota bacterium]|nr:MAG: alpha/beta hydrolase [Calditrichota bacterium]MBL1206202.1 alpha/beta hydrolase [Calditrichota bacterium]NOG46027.1 alpha/beta hydrolase [Calditrichota bacterium]